MKKAQSPPPISLEQSPDVRNDHLARAAPTKWLTEPPANYSTNPLTHIQNQQQPSIAETCFLHTTKVITHSQHARILIHHRSRRCRAIGPKRTTHPKRVPNRKCSQNHTFSYPLLLTKNLKSQPPKSISILRIPQRRDESIRRDKAEGRRKDTKRFQTHNIRSKFEAEFEE